MFDVIDALPADPLGDVWWDVARIPPPTDQESGMAWPAPAAGSRWWRDLLDTDPGGLLAGAVEALTGDGAIADQDDDTVVAAAVGAQRVLSWAMGAQLIAVAELARRWQASPLGERAAVAELALACAVSEYAMGQRLDAALLLPYRLPEVWAALRAGRLEWAKAWEILDKTLVLSDAQVATIEPGVVAVALTSNLPDLRAHLSQAVLQADPDGAAERATAAHARRAVTVRPGPDATATMALTASAAAIAAADAALNRLTAAARSGLDDEPDAGSDPDRTPSSDPRSDPPSDPRSDPRSDSGADRSPQVTRADVLLDLIHSADADLTRRPDAGAGGQAEPLDPEARSGPDSGPLDPKAPSDAPTGILARGRAQVVVTVPLSTLLALTDHPGELAGYGPIPAGMARELITFLITDTAIAGTWRCAVTDDRPGHPHGTLLGLGRPTYSPAYVPGAATRDYLASRDGTCRFPGCRRLATRSSIDLDHRRPWSPSGASGPTCECNLHSPVAVITTGSSTRPPSRPP